MPWLPIDLSSRQGQPGHRGQQVKGQSPYRGQHHRRGQGHRNSQEQRSRYRNQSENQRRKNKLVHISKVWNLCMNQAILLKIESVISLVNIPNAFNQLVHLN